LQHRPSFLHRRNFSRRVRRAHADLPHIRVRRHHAGVRLLYARPGCLKLRSCDIHRALRLRQSFLVGSQRTGGGIRIGLGTVV
jgi:hypothetical protein